MVQDRGSEWSINDNDSEPDDASQGRVEFSEVKPACGPQA